MLLTDLSQDDSCVLAEAGIKNVGKNFSRQNLSSFIRTYTWIYVPFYRLYSLTMYLP